MFTGIVSTIGTVLATEPLDGGQRLTISAPWAGELDPGQSVAVDGVCLTVVAADNTAFTVEAVRETLARTIAGQYAAAARVHLERPLRAGEPIGGHFVQGHVDAVSRVRSMEERGENRYIELELPPLGRSLVAARGSIAVNGVSLTVLEVEGSAVRLAIIPHTWAVTTFAELRPGDSVNVEFDIIARYLKRIDETRVI